MADLKISQLNAITTLTPATDVLPVVDSGGVTKKITTNQILGSGGTATLASATITGDLTVDTSTLKVDSANDRVGVVTATPRVSLDVASGDIYSSGQITWGGSSPTANQGFLSFTGGNAVIGSTGATALLFYTNGTERYRIASDGVATWSNVGGVAGTAMTLNSNGLGIGVTPSAWNSSYRGLQLGAGGAISAHTSASLPWLVATSNSFINSAGDWKFINNGYSTRYLARGDDGTQSWWTSNNGSAGGTVSYTQAMTLDASGNLLVGKTASGAYTNGTQLFPAGTVATGHPNGTGSGAAYSIFAYDGVRTGDITQNGTTGVLYNTASDYRLKEQVQPLSGGLARVNALKPSVYKWKSDGSNGEGFLAHELAEVVPFAVSGEKDAVNEDGSIKSQGIDMSRVVPILVAAIQELTARVQTLETR